MVQIKEERIEDDNIITDVNWIPPDIEEPNLDQFIVHPLFESSLPNNLDLKLIKMKPVVVLERITVSENKKLPRRRGRPPKSKLKYKTKKCDILKPEKIEVIEGLTSNFGMDDDNNFEPPIMESSINCEENESPYIPPWD
jgi:hypothetical protein